MPLFYFKGDVSKWSEFIKYFYSRVHCKPSFDDSLRMTFLISIPRTTQEDNRNRWYKCHILFKRCKSIKTPICKYLISGTLTLKIYASQAANKAQRSGHITRISPPNETRFIVFIIIKGKSTSKLNFLIFEG